VREFYRFLAHDEHAYTELRLIDPSGRRKPKQLFVQSEEEFLKIVKQYDGKYQIYAGINQRKEKSGRKEAVDKVRTICIDIDAKRDKNQPASDYELARAEEVADKIISDLTEKGFKPPVKVMSGNGFHLFFSIPEILVDDFSRDFVEDRIKRFNRWISKKYTDEYAGIDNIGDLPRIVKIRHCKLKLTSL
jgi:DNA primase